METAQSVDIMCCKSYTYLQVIFPERGRVERGRVERGGEREGEGKKASMKIKIVKEFYFGMW